MPEITSLRQLNDYWGERVTIELDRLTVLTLVGAGILALKHPDMTGPSSLVIRSTLAQLVPLVYQHVPTEILQEWDRVLGTMFC